MHWHLESTNNAAGYFYYGAFIQWFIQHNGELVAAQAGNKSISRQCLSGRKTIL
jgi:hypothetical protein|tara:strand:+ start:269 stop:430 length:162 start_codon:yes stop_codon:yes gene_type:complete